MTTDDSAEARPTSDDSSVKVPPGPDAVRVRDRPEQRRYEATVEGAVAGVAKYRLADDLITFTHTVVDPAFRGAHVGTTLARFALDDARARGLRVRPDCPFIRSYIERHPEYEDLLD